MSTSCTPEMMYCEGYITSVVFLTKRHNLNLLMKKHLKKVNLEILFKKKVIKVYSIHQSVKVMTKEMLQIEGNYRDKQLSVMWDPEPYSYTEKNTREKSGRILMKSLVYSVALYRREFSGFDNCTMITEDVNIIGQLDEGST